MTPDAAAGWADVVVMLFPDEEQARVYREELAPNLRPGAALAFAHGLAIRFALIEPRPDLDVFLVAPKGPGTALREAYLKDGGLISLFAVHKDRSEEHTSELPSLMRISYAVFFLQKKNKNS